jgi:DNA-binding response OmpR family regulator
MLAGRYHPPEGGGVLTDYGESDSTPPAGRRRVLVIEEDATTRLMLCAALMLWKYYAEGARPSDCTAALPDVRAFSLIILDIHSPEESGYAVLRSLSAIARRPPVIVLTTSPASRLALDPEVVKVVISKPFELPWLRDCVSSLTA